MECGLSILLSLLTIVLSVCQKFNHKPSIQSQAFHPNHPRPSASHLHALSSRSVQEGEDLDPHAIPNPGHGRSTQTLADAMDHLVGVREPVAHTLHAMGMPLPPRSVTSAHAAESGRQAQLRLAAGDDELRRRMWGKAAVGMQTVREPTREPTREATREATRDKGLEGRGHSGLHGEPGTHEPGDDEPPAGYRVQLQGTGYRRREPGDDEPDARALAVSYFNAHAQGAPCPEWVVVVVSRDLVSQ